MLTGYIYHCHVERQQMTLNSGTPLQYIPHTCHQCCCSTRSVMHVTGNATASPFWGAEIAAKPTLVLCYQLRVLSRSYRAACAPSSTRRRGHVASVPYDPFALYLWHQFVSPPNEAVAVAATVVFYGRFFTSGVPRGLGNDALRVCLACANNFAAASTTRNRSSFVQEILRLND